MNRLTILDRDRAKKLIEMFNDQSNFMVIVLSKTDEIITSLGFEEVSVAGEQAFRSWLQKKSLFWSGEAKLGEFQWNNIACNRCYQRPLLGQRFGCPFVVAGGLGSSLAPGIGGGAAGRGL